MSAIAIGAAALASFQGTAGAQTREHVLLARQTPVPATSTFDLAAPGDPSVLAAWFIDYEGIEGDLSSGSGGGADDCWDWTDADTGEAMSSCP